mgnify:CR=1 FL=1
MAISDKQRELDKIKWEKSVMLGIDACGTFDYCVMCDKSKENPCECAFNRFYNVDLGDHELVIGAPEEKFEVVEKVVAKKPTKTAKTKSSKTAKKDEVKAVKSTKKTPAKKSTSKPVAKKETTKKSVAKKSTAKSAVTKKSTKATKKVTK